VQDHSFSDWPEEFRNCISKGPLVVFLGSGISRDHPSGIPTGDNLKNDIFEAIIQKRKLSESVVKEARDVVSQYRLEVFLFLIDEWAGTKWRYLLDFMLDAQPNLNHYTIAHLIHTNKIKHVVTTNFDCLIEDAFKEYDLPINLYYSDADFEQWSINESILGGIFKLHGSLVDVSRESTHETITGSITQVANKLTPGLSQNKADFLRYVLENFVVIFLGYSGRDEFDIYPAIYNSNAKQIIWISHKNEDKLPEFEFYTNVIEKEPDHIDQLILKHKNTIRVHYNTSSFISHLSEFLTGNRIKMDDQFIHKELKHHGYVPSANSPYLLIGLLLRYSNNWKSAAKAFDLALGDTKKEDRYYLADIYRGKGICSKEVDNSSDALKYFKKAHNLCESEYSVFEKNTDPFIHQRHFRMMSQICEDIGLTYYNDEDLDNALNWVERAGEWSTRLVHPNQIRFLARNCGNLGLIYFNLCLEHDNNEQYLEEANLCFQCAVSGEEIVGNIVGLAKSLNNWAYLYVRTFQWEEALYRNTICLALMKSLQGPFSKYEMDRAVSMVVCSLCGLAPDSNKAEILLKELQGRVQLLQQESFEECVKLYKITEKRGLVFMHKPEPEQAKDIVNIFRIVFKTVNDKL